MECAGFWVLRVLGGVWGQPGAQLEMLLVSSGFMELYLILAQRFFSLMWS